MLKVSNDFSENVCFVKEDNSLWDWGGGGDQGMLVVLLLLKVQIFHFYGLLN